MLYQITKRLRKICTFSIIKFRSPFVQPNNNIITPELKTDIAPTTRKRKQPYSIFERNIIGKIDEQTTTNKILTQTFNKNLLIDNCVDCCTKYNLNTIQAIETKTATTRTDYYY